MEKTGGPAFPMPPIHFPNGEVLYGSSGMSVRTYMAIHAPAAEIEGIYPATVAGCAAYLGLRQDAYIPEIHFSTLVAKARYQWADAMLAMGEAT